MAKKKELVSDESIQVNRTADLLSKLHNVCAIYFSMGRMYRYIGNCDLKSKRGKDLWDKFAALEKEGDEIRREIAFAIMEKK